MINEIIRRMKAVSIGPETGYVVEAPISKERFYDRLLRAMLAEGINQCFITVMFDPDQVEALVVRSMTESELADCEQENIENLTEAILERLNALEARSGQHFLVTYPFHIPTEVLDAIARALPGARLAVLDDPEPTHFSEEALIALRVDADVFEAIIEAPSRRQPQTPRPRRYA